MIYRKSYPQENGLVNCQFRIGESNIMISSDKPIKTLAKKFLVQIRCEIERYIKLQPEFSESFKPIKIKKNAPLIIKQMSKASHSANVGPMAAIAGAIAEELGNCLDKHVSELIIENGGDIFVNVKRQIVIGVRCHNKTIKDNLGILLNKKRGRCAICTSSGTIGHSFSYGKADAATVIAKNGAIADAWATRLGNEIKSQKDIKKALSLLKNIKDVSGALVLYKKTIAAWGDIELTQITG